MIRERVGQLFFMVCMCGALAFYFLSGFSFGYALPTLVLGETKEEYREVRILFVGDVLLGRNVETLMGVAGQDYPFLGITHFLRSADVVIANFEGAIPETHEKTQDFSFRFSVQAPYLEVLESHNVSVLSFANNHALDFGEEAYQHALRSCHEYMLVCKGHPDREDGMSSSVIEVGDEQVGVVFLEAVQSPLHQESVQQVLQELRKKTREQIAFVHWGEEYVLTHNEEQADIAEFLIDEGVDVVIGHHPHVVQDIQIYKGKPIFFSLGNFIFDQYFDQHVTEGLIVQMTIKKDVIEYLPVPVTSSDTRSQPRLMTLGERNTLLERILLHKNEVLDTLNPVFVVQR